MPQAKRKRRSKHRGNAAGTVEARGRTSRRPEGGGSRPAGRESTREAAREKRLARLDRPPTWGGAAFRGGLAAVFFFAVTMLLLDRSVAQAGTIAAFMLLIYIPMAYATDLFIYRRRQKGKLGGRAPGP
jgi:hypothetical protein